MRLVSIRIASEQLHAVRYRRSKRGQGRDRTTDLPLFRSKDHRLGAATLVVYRAQRQSLACGRPPCTEVNETRNETTPAAFWAMTRPPEESGRAAPGRSRRAQRPPPRR